MKLEIAAFGQLAKAITLQKKKTHLIVEIKPTGPEFSSYKAFDGFQFPFIGSPPRFLV